MEQAFEHDATYNDLRGFYDIVYSPDDGGYYSQLLWKNRGDTSPIYKTRAGAMMWALKKGGISCLRG